MTERSAAPVFELPEDFSVGVGAKGVSISAPTTVDGRTVWTTVLEIRWADDAAMARESIVFRLYRQLRTFAALKDEDARAVNDALLETRLLRERFARAIAALRGEI